MIFEDIEPQLIQASQGKRFVNYLVDVLIFYILIVGVSFVLAIFAPETLYFLDDSGPGFQLVDRLISLVLYALYMGVMETLFKGKSIGKFITKTRAVNEDGTNITAGKAFMRGLCRAVPFCAFSALGNPSYPWQDRWTNTYVIDEPLSRVTEQRDVF